MEYKTQSLKERPELFEIQDKICEEVWPDFMLHDQIANKYWMQFIKAYPDHQLLLINNKNGEILSIINSVPIFYDKKIMDLPDTGWDWGVEKSVTDYSNGIKGNYLLGIQIVVNKKYQKRGLSTIAVTEMINFFKKKKYKKLIIPIRPSLKHKYPLTGMEKYIKWKNKDNLPFDPWLRIHIKLGGKIIKPCYSAMNIKGTIIEWEEWTGMIFPGTGKYIIEGALVPIDINLEENYGIYVEPNVWVVHE